MKRGFLHFFSLRFPSSRAHHIIQSMAYLDRWRHWRQQLATVANSEKLGPLQQILRLMKSIAFLICINEERESLDEGLYSFLEDMEFVAPDRGEPDTQADPSREVTARSESPRVSDARYQSGCKQRTDTWNVIKTFARCIGPVPDDDHAIKVQDLLLEAEQLTAERHKTSSRYIRNTFVVWIGDDGEQLLDTAPPNRRDNAKLSKMRPDRVDH